MEGEKLKKVIIVMSTPAKIYFLTYAFPPCHSNKYLSPTYHLGHWISSDFIHSFLHSAFQQSFIDCLPCTRHCLGCYKYSKWKKTQKSKADSMVEWSEGDGIVRGEERKHTGKELVGHKKPCGTLAFNLSNGGPGKALSRGIRWSHLYFMRFTLLAVLRIHERGTKGEVARP